MTDEKATSRARSLRRAAAVFGALGDSARFRIVMFLAGGEQHVGAITAMLAVSQPATSYHLGICRRAGLIEPRRAGRRCLYGLTDRGLACVSAVRAMIG